MYKNKINNNNKCCELGCDRATYNLQFSFICISIHTKQTNKKKTNSSSERVYLECLWVVWNDVAHIFVLPIRGQKWHRTRHTQNKIWKKTKIYRSTIEIYRDCWDIKLEMLIDVECPSQFTYLRFCYIVQTEFLQILWIIQNRNTHQMETKPRKKMFFCGNNRITVFRVELTKLTIYYLM